MEGRGGLENNEFIANKLRGDCLCRRVDELHVNVVGIGERGWNRDDVSIGVNLLSGSAETTGRKCLIQFFLEAWLDDSHFTAVDFLHVCSIYVDSRYVNTGVCHYYSRWKANVAKSDECNFLFCHFGVPNLPACSFETESRVEETANRKNLALFIRLF